MIITGIIAEYNPYHNGHAYLADKARELLGADCVVSVMSGDFVQRGAPALFNKYARTRAALTSSDLVFELPFVYATASAEYFAFGGVALLTALGADYLAFGSECGDIGALTRVADILSEEPADFKAALEKSLKAGNSFPKARKEALLDLLPKEYAAILDTPNNLLGIEYLKAIKKLKALGKTPPKPITVKRLGSYEDTALPEGSYASATALRSSFETLAGEKTVCKENAVLSPSKTLERYVPGAALKEYEKTLEYNHPATVDALSPYLSHALLLKTEEELAAYADWNADLAKRALSLPKNLSFTQAIENLKSKNITYTRASRMLLSLILEKREELLKAAKDEGSNAFYARLLGFKHEKADCLKYIKQNSKIPVVEKVAPFEKSLTGTGLCVFQADLRAAALYDLTFAKQLPGEYRNGVEII